MSASAPKWITADSHCVNDTNKWIIFTKTINLKRVPSEVMVDIAADTKYWLWVNDSLAVFEGGLKRGPKPGSTYYDRINLSPYLSSGKNDVSILLWHFGKDGFSHVGSGKAGLIMRCDNVPQLNSNSSWFSRVYDAYGTMGSPKPNYRLPESNISFDARKGVDKLSAANKSLRRSVESGSWGDAPWGPLVLRPIPQWRDYGMTRAQFVRMSDGHGHDTIMTRLPYNMQMTPYFVLSDDQGGRKVQIFTDHSFAGGTENIRAEYVTRKGEQSYESLGWMNGERLYLVVPSDVYVKELGYRETGYDTEIAGKFECDDDFYSRFWDKAMRTLYVNMRDTWFDCPDRERAQWWGDAVVLMGESFYTYSPSVHQLMRKAILELVGWQRPDGTISSPVPGNYKHELPAQMLASVGLYGFWNYYMNTGDSSILSEVYPAVKRYLDVWSLDETGLTAMRKGGWNWGDWGTNRDMRLIYAGWHYMALDAAARMADQLGYTADAEKYRADMVKVKNGYNKCWNGYAYRHPSYQGETDDRVQALAVIAGIAGPDKYPAITELLKTQEHASPYMEKYVMESLFQMGQGDYAMQRIQKRFGPMVDNRDHTTLFEGWGIGKEGFGGGTTNHAWSGGAVTVIGQYLFGVEPIEPAYKLFAINQNPALFRNASITIPSVAGDITSGFEIGDSESTMHITIPDGTEALVYIPVSSPDVVKVNGSEALASVAKPDASRPISGKLCYRFPAGAYTIAYKNKQ
ncbi:MAG: glycoside hydrolase [Muribaculaceae bacterium]|nr:glycoside hydrolase [Muribaculaceae bacterium]